jgi:hypothetical protein
MLGQHVQIIVVLRFRPLTETNTLHGEHRNLIGDIDAHRQFRPVQQAALPIFRIKLIEDHVGTARLVREHVLHALVPMRFLISIL